MDEKTKYCKFCGEIIDYDCVVCPKCGKQIEPLKTENVVINNNNVINSSKPEKRTYEAYEPGVSPKSRMAALLLTIFWESLESSISM